MALAAYRGLLRAARTAFQGDNYVLNAALTEARRGFEVNRDLDIAGQETQVLIKNAQEVAKMLRTNVVQGKLNDSGRYKLRIHDGIERGDNESTKIPKSTFGGGTGTDGCCSP
ncbi:Mitochondrial zinc maintenance protein 1, mitochondrial [Maublancomyces gigas]|uniref:Mitochondrial zinc maintenance protein 1, mitochondrial n=1 Tax=Discina gigas TaxID=1032678 RepID=A0ABR3GQY6_9PEZI